MRLQSSLLIFGQGALCEEVHSPSLNRSGNGEGNRPRGCNNYAGSRCCRRRHRSGDGAIVSLAGAQDVDALLGKRGVPLQLHRSLDRLNALGSRRDGMFKRGLEALIGFDQLHMLLTVRRGDSRA
jgi:hypothetical protein